MPVSFWRRWFGRDDTGSADSDLPVKVIVGLGNPGRDYARTRHNVGWWVVDHLADVWHFDPWKKDGVALTTAGSLGGTRVRLVKPQTFMNLSGQALRPYLRRETFAPGRDLLVIVDEVALPVGSWRYRAKGSAGGHNGLKDVERALGTQEYSRLRLGIRPADATRRISDLSDFVLDEFGKGETAVVRELMPVVTDAVEGWVKDGEKGAMDVQSRKGGSQL
jgi:PTH1 family peptidyl-tRNA hydrolase